MGILHQPFPAELGERGTLKIGTDALAEQRARSAMAKAHQSCHVLGTPGVRLQEFTAIPQVTRATCVLTSLKGQGLLHVSPTQHKEGCWWVLALSLCRNNTFGQCRTLNKATWASPTGKICSLAELPT